MKVYISGKISGIENEAMINFSNAEYELLNLGHKIVNPMTLNHNHDKSWASYMKEDIIALCKCDAIFMLSNWKESKGAIIEHDLSEKLGLVIMYQNINDYK